MKSTSKIVSKHASNKFNKFPNLEETSHPINFETTHLRPEPSKLQNNTKNRTTPGWKSRLWPYVMSQNTHTHPPTHPHPQTHTNSDWLTLQSTAGCGGLSATFVRRIACTNICPEINPPLCLGGGVCHGVLSSGMAGFDLSIFSIVGCVFFLISIEIKCVSKY